MFVCIRISQVWWFVGFGLGAVERGSRVAWELSVSGSSFGLLFLVVGRRVLGDY